MKSLPESDRDGLGRLRAREVLLAGQQVAVANGEASSQAGGGGDGGIGDDDDASLPFRRVDDVHVFQTHGILLEEMACHGPGVQES
jgi:hypothetical protein